MHHDLLVLRSITYAYKAQHLLEQHGLSAYLARTPEQYAPSGCSYSLQVSNGEQAAAILREGGIRVLRVVPKD